MRTAIPIYRYFIPRKVLWMNFIIHILFHILNLR